jgi:MoaA/NifB/PqqE/SkfB family radical SAM enzyme
MGIDPYSKMNKITIPEYYDYVGVYLTDRCHLACPYCITRHHGTSFGVGSFEYLSPREWIDGLNRFVLPDGVPVTVQGGEPFLYAGIWELLEGLEHKVDIMTALPPHVTKKDFMRLKTLAWNTRPAPYPTIRVSYHQGQHEYQELIERIAELQEILSIGLYYLDHPGMQDEIEELRLYAVKRKIELRSKEFLGEYNGQIYGSYLYKDAAQGTRVGTTVTCKNTVVPIAPDGTVYHCHSDLYFDRKDLALGNVRDANCQLPTEFLPCDNYGLCSECDVKVKTNHLQQYGYTSVAIKFENMQSEVGSKT